jgi:hypothetical protein
MGGTVGALLGIAGASIGIWNSKRIARGEQGFLIMRKWNVYDSFYTAMIGAGLVTLAIGLLFVRSEMIVDSYALILLSLGFLFTGSLNAIIRVRALQLQT